MNDPRHPTDLLAAHALGALEEAERAAVERHLAGCPECRRELADWQATADRLADAVPPVTPSAQVRERLLAAVASAPAPARSAPAPLPPPRVAVRSRRSATGWLALAASLAALVLASWALVRQGMLLDDLERARAQRRRLLAAHDALTTELARTRSRLAELSATLQMVSSPETRRIALAGLGSAADATGTALVDPRGGAARFSARGLPAPPPGRTYQLWFITAEEGPVSAGVFAVDQEGSGDLEVENVPPPERVLAWAVTVEPEGGVPAPTGEMVLKS